MNILFLSQIVPYPPHGGVLQRGYNLIRELGRENKIHLLAFIHPNILKTPEAIASARQELEKFCTHVEFFDLRVKCSILSKYKGLFRSLASSLPFGVHAHYSKPFNRRVHELTMNGRFDVVHYDTIFLSRFTTATKTLPLVVTHHNIESLLMERRSKFEKGAAARLFLSIQARRIRKYEASETGKYDVNIVVSQTDGEELRRINPRVDLAVVPNGVDTEYFRPGSEGNCPSLIYTGGMGMFANRDAVLNFVNDIWPMIKTAVPDVTFYAVGQDPPQELLRLATADPGIKVTGYVDDIRPLVSSATVYVVPLRVGGGTRLKVVDAMAMGKAIVSTSIGCEGLKVSDGKDIQVADGNEAFAGKTIRLLKNKAERETLGTAARLLVEAEYSWKRIGRLLGDSYKKASAKHGNRKTR